MSSHPQKGNVLFLILIAVALFAALSYAVMSSSRSGGGDTTGETLKLQYSTIQSFVSAMRSSIMRMTVGGIAAEDIGFQHPVDWPFLSPSEIQRNLFHPSGGGVPFQHLGLDKNIKNDSQVVAFYEIQGVGTSTGTHSGTDIIYGITVSESFCNYVNKRIGYNGPIIDANGIFDDVGVTNASLADNGFVYEITTAFSLPLQFVGKNEGCVLDSARGDYFYYTTLLER